MIKGSEPPDSPPPPYSSYSGCASPEAYSSDDQKYQPLQHQQGPIIHGHKPPGTRTNYGNPNMGQQQQQHPLLHHNLPPGQHPPPQPYRPDINAYSAPAGTAAGSRVIIAQPHLAGSSRTGEIVVDCPSEPPNSYLALSIVTCLCFSPLLGLIAICFSGLYIFYLLSPHSEPLEDILQSMGGY